MLKTIFVCIFFTFVHFFNHLKLFFEIPRNFVFTLLICRIKVNKNYYIVKTTTTVQQSHREKYKQKSIGNSKHKVLVIDTQMYLLPNCQLPQVAHFVDLLVLNFPLLTFRQESSNLQILSEKFQLIFEKNGLNSRKRNLKEIFNIK